MEAAVFGGTCREIWLFDGLAMRGVPFGGQIRANWNNYSSEALITNGAKLLKRPANWNQNDSYPIPISYVRKIHTQDFWISKFQR